MECKLYVRAVDSHREGTVRRKVRKVGRYGKQEGTVSRIHRVCTKAAVQAGSDELGLPRGAVPSMFVSCE